MASMDVNFRVFLFCKILVNCQCMNLTDFKKTRKVGEIHGWNCTKKISSHLRKNRILVFIFHLDSNVEFCS